MLNKRRSLATQGSQAYGMCIYTDTWPEGFITFDVNDPSNVSVLNSSNTEYGLDYCSADQYYYYVDHSNNFFKMDLDGNVVAKIATLTSRLSDGAWNATNNTMYAVYSEKLYTVDLSTGDLYTLATKDILFKGIACNAEGQLYTIMSDGNLYTVDATTGDLTLVGATGYDHPNYAQSMQFDHNTGNLYWCYSDEFFDHFIQVDPTTGTATMLLENTGETTGLCFPICELEDGINLSTSGLTNFTGKACNVSYTRSFTSGTASTICLPFAYEKKAADGSFYAFSGIEKVGGEYVATMTEPGATTLEANTPYLYLPNATGGVDFSGTYTIPATLTPEETTVGDWTFKGTYTTIEWETAPTGTYGFAGQTAGGVSQGQFVKVGAYVRIKPMRCYLENASFAGARGTNRAAEQLPETIQVRLVSASGEVTGIGTISTKTGEVTMDKDAWYTLDGRRVMNPTKGVYIKRSAEGRLQGKNGKKVVIK